MKKYMETDMWRLKYEDLGDISEQETNEATLFVAATSKDDAIMKYLKAMAI